MIICIKTLGCKSNRYESDKLFEALKPKNDVFENNFFYKKPDILIVNTCTVTESADRKSRQAILTFKRANPSCKIIVFGCGAKVSPEDYKKMPEVSHVFEKAAEVIKFIENLSGSQKCEYKKESIKEDQRTRALIKIQDGCNRYCTYCIIPRARGPERSFPSEEILSEVKQKEREGYKEIVLTGIIMSEWNEKEVSAKGKNLADLIELLLKNTKNVRFRLSSLEPKNFSEKFYKLFRKEFGSEAPSRQAVGSPSGRLNERLCPHIHMSLQSGSDSVLKRMRRQYDTKFFYDICKKLRKVVPDIGITTDVIVGFPGETEQEFKDTCEFVKKIGFLKVHVFPYSRRKNTPAYYMPDQISPKTKKMRTKKLITIAEKGADEFKKSLIGKTYDVLIEHSKGNFCKGYTPNYVPIKFNYKQPETLLNTIVQVKIKKTNLL